MSHAYDHLEPAELWRQFAGLNAVPRPSRKEQAACEHVRTLALEAGLDVRSDDIGNVVVYVPATSGREGAPAVTIQAHLDMVCEARPDVAHDFDTQPILPQRAGDWILATGTTLGADNGIGAACALALLRGAGGPHGPLELLFTVEEEIGLVGALKLDWNLLSARLMINLDSEDPAELTVGCAGGARTNLRLPAKAVPVPRGLAAISIVIGGLKGGHSGVQIHEPLGNSLKLLSRVLDRAAVQTAVRISSISGGNASNAIPRDASTLVLVPAESREDVLNALRREAELIVDQWFRAEPDLAIAIDAAEAPPSCLSADTSERILELLRELPHGVLAVSKDFPGTVETSSNVARVRVDGSFVQIDTSSRSFRTESLAALQAEINRIASDHGAEVDAGDAYPAWAPNPHSQLLATTRRAYARLNGIEPKVRVIHAGLECGALLGRGPEGAEAISFGPRIEGAHTPEERVHIPSVRRTWDLLVALLDDLSA